MFNKKIYKISISNFPSLAASFAKRENVSCSLIQIILPGKYHITHFRYGVNVRFKQLYFLNCFGLVNDWDRY